MKKGVNAMRRNFLLGVTLIVSVVIATVVLVPDTTLILDARNSNPDVRLQQSDYSQPPLTDGKQELSGNRSDNEAIRMAADDFYQAVIPGMVQNEAHDGAGAGEPLYAEDFYKKIPASMFVPMIAAGQVTGLAIYRLFDGKNYAPASMADVSREKWGKFPPLSQSEAEALLVKYAPYPYQPVPGLVFLHGDIPYCRFVIPGEEEVVYLVSAFDGEIHPMLADSVSPKQKEEDVPVFIDNEGLVVIDESKIEGWSEERLSALVKDTAKSNEAIKAGLLKVRPDFTVVYDKREPTATITRGP